MGRRRYSELECFTIGLLWQLGPCSPYDVRQHMLNSPSTQWSASAGAIYPLIQRLHKRGLLAAKSERTGKRRRKEYSVTPAGLKVLRGWIGPPIPEDAVTVTYDPLRSRARFLGALTQHQREAWVEAAAAALLDVADRVKRWQEIYGVSDDAMVSLITRHGELDVTARRQWIAELKSAIDRPASR